VPVETEAPVRGRALGQAASRVPAEAYRRVSKRERQLQTSTTIDVMYLYTEGGKDVLGGISDTQMQTTLATALATANEAMDNSDIG
ncbi:unnamed protein product, partial [Ascophyllum nodosum]